MNEKYLTYRGAVKAVVGVGGTVAFVTVHPEGQPTAVYRLDADTLSLEADPLPAGGVALVADGDTLWIAGSDGKIYRGSARGGEPAPLKAAFKAPPTALALVCKDRLAVLAGQEVVILNRKDGKAVQTITLPEPGSALAADPTGQWLVIGMARGTVAVYECEDKGQFAQSESDRLHEGVVTALLFETEELRFLSAGADHKLLTTHARGRLEPEDKGRGNNHTDLVTALLWGPGDRFFSGSRDSSVKSWPRVGNVKPVTQKDGVARVVGLALVEVHNRPQLVVACEDNTLRFFTLDETGRFGEPVAKVSDAFAWVKHELAKDDSRRRESALKTLAEYNDTPAVELLAEWMKQDSDHSVRLLAAQLLAQAKHPRAPTLLEMGLNHRDEAVRIASFQGLRKHLGENNLRPLTLALRTAKVEIGRLAVQALEGLAKTDDQALELLTRALNAQTLEVRQAALDALERVYPPDSPAADLVALGVTQSDLRRLALVRLFQRGMVKLAEVQIALRRRCEDEDPDVRRTAFLVSLFTRDRLVSALRARDPELHRQLVELETYGMEPAEVEKRMKPPQPAAKLELDPADYEPLLQATASRALDTCLRGGRGLAVLGDPRAFGLLLQLSREEDTQARVEVCRALAALDDPRAVKRLRSLLYDREAAVRDAAFTALAAIHESDPMLCAEAGLGAAYEDVRRRGMQALVRASRKTPPKQAGAPGWDLLIRALNDSFAGVRSEAFKAVLNLQIGGGGPQTLLFARQSTYPDVRREVLTEAIAQASEPWAWTMVLEFFNDADPQLRADAFAFAVKKTKELQPLEAALVSRFTDIRRMAVDALIKRHSAAAQALLVRALADSAKEVRQLALESLIHEDAQGPLTEALTSPHADVRVRAAQALARRGAQAALAPLMALATAPEPPEKERQSDWAALVEGALEGLAELGDPAAVPGIYPLLDSPHAHLRKAAAKALMWVSRTADLEALRQGLQHVDPQVKYHAALGLAYVGDPLGLAPSIVFSDQAAQVLTPEERLVAALTLGPAGEDQLAVFLDDPNEALRNQALLLLMLLELKANLGTPARCLACLSSRMPRVRLTAARALEHFADPAAFLQFVVQLMNDRGDEPAWRSPPETDETLAEVLVHGAPHTRARTALLLRHLSAREQNAWDQAWSAHAARFAGEISTIRQLARAHPPVQPRDPLQVGADHFGR